ncbi:undecaprenyl-diphosphate phosphatase [Virgibacillus sp. AGTR]|uniref:undecaprenyl-diphosphate phosphatase n=1 Tax=Virgibacillus sp. AGTR TaxID=2812055 RepID=UPI001D15E644|nr:undecaprenyl-diphosphate phosphatase [Virgibacillus sp. AGTR]MCC2251667.1 undecaprenyl-diphosphate phosphatase [Virgibacillus sp. AGTR]
METLTELGTLIKYVILGLFQGFTEPIPISSSGHLVILRELFGIEIKGLSFEILVNFGSLLAVLVIFRKDIIRLIVNGWRYLSKKEETAKADFQFILFLIIATIPTGILGLLFEDYISEKLSFPVVVGYTLLITGAALWVIRNLRGKKNDGDLTVKDALIVGAAQAVSLIPGISRSGATIVAAMLVGMKQETALRFSFLLYIPVSLGITVLKLPKIVTSPEFSALMIPNILAFLVSIIASYFALKWFINIMAKGNLKYFAFYCFIVGILVIIFL